MDQKDKALKIALSAVAVMAVAMFLYYWLAWRTRKTENDVNFHEKVEASATEEKSDFVGVYSSSETVEGLNRRLAFISINRQEGGGSYFGTAKVDTIGSAVENAAYLKCNDVNITEKDFFVKCSDPDLGQISFNGEWQKSGGALQVTGKVLWSKDGSEVTNKATTLTHTSN